MLKLRYFTGRTETKADLVPVEPHGHSIYNKNATTLKQSDVIFASSSTSRHQHKSSLVERTGLVEVTARPPIQRNGSKLLLPHGVDLLSE
jgi:hypothetical protein